MEDAVKLNKVTLNVCDKAGVMANELLVKLQSKSSSKVAETEQVICQLQQNVDELKQRIEAKESITSSRGGGSFIVNYAALNNGITNNDDQNDTANADSLKDLLKSEEENLQIWKNKLHQYQHERDNISNDLGPVSTLQFQKYAIEKVKPAFEKYVKLYKDDYSRDASLDYPLYHSKLAFKANKIFDILYLKECIENNTPMTQLNSMIDDLKHHKEEIFTNRFLSEMKEEMPKLLEFVSEIAFDFENDVKESHLYVNRLKARARNAKK